MIGLTTIEIRRNEVVDATNRVVPWSLVVRLLAFLRLLPVLSELDPQAVLEQDYITKKKRRLQREKQRRRQM
jgi:hypothetical protein